MTTRLGWLSAGVLAFWLVSAYPLRAWGGQAVVVDSAVAGLLCLIPTAATLLWGRWALGQNATHQLLLVVGGTGLRMFFVLATGLVLYLSLSYFQQSAFWVCVLVYYLVTLALEMVVLLWPSGSMARATPAARTGVETSTPAVSRERIG